ncbi:MAG TPA: pitrilysin family protein [Candidatus Polarisedimenticolaceae bacterium]|nr:pitrilysin family protein [Candidatus Polarisedimenticolaceae bacterium]
MKTVLLPSRATPFVSFRFLFETGSIDDPRGREGTAALAGAALAEGGTRKLSYEQLLEALYPMAAGIGVQVDREVTVVQGTVHADHLDRYYDLVRQVLIEPRFDLKEVSRLKDDQENALVAGLRATDDEGLGKEALMAMMYAGHPYGRPVEGTVAGLQAIGRDEVVAFRDAHLTQDRLTVGLAGRFPDAFADRVLADLAGLPTNGAVRPALPAPKKASGMEALVVTKPARAWAISLGHPIAVTRADDDFYPLFVANSYFGEHRTFNGVLMNAMRSLRGLNYGDYSYVEAFVQDGGSTFPLPNVGRRQQAFTIWIRPVAPAHAHFATRQAVRELRRLIESGLTRAAFEETREFLGHYDKLWVQTPSRRLGYAMDGAFYGTGSLPEELGRRLPSMTVDDVNAAIRRHLSAENLHLAVVADPDGAGPFVEALGANAPSPIVYETETRPEVVIEDRSIAVEKLDTDPRRCRVVPADTMFEV